MNNFEKKNNYVMIENDDGKCSEFVVGEGSEQ